MKKNLFFNLILLSLFCFFNVFTAKADIIEQSNIASITVNPFHNNTYTLNIYFDKPYNNKAFIEKNADGFYYVYLPDTTINDKKLNITYKNKSDKNKIKFNSEQKQYINKNQESNYVRLSVEMDSDYSLKIISKDVKEKTPIYNSNNEVNTMALILVGLTLICFVLIRRVYTLVKPNAVKNSYTSFPENFRIKRINNKTKISSNKSLNYMSEPELINKIKNEEQDSFTCFDVPEQNDYTKNYVARNIMQNNSKMHNLKSMRIKTYTHTLPINDMEESELDLPVAEDIIKHKSTAEKIKEKSGLLSILSIDDERGFYLETEDDKINLFGFNGKNIFLLKQFKDLSQINLQARFYDKNGDNDIYIVRIDTYKSMVEITENSMKELVVL